MQLTPELRQEYDTMFATCSVRPERAAIVKKVVARMMASRKRYQAAGKACGVPWFVVGMIHQLECSGRFDRHFHNGDPLSARTVQKPKGRPKEGKPPFTWEQSANDAMRLKGFHRYRDWTVAGILWLLEDYNGWGYRKTNPEVKSPYLWSLSNHYVRGKYVKDGVFDPKAESAQVGCALMMKELVFEIASANKP